ILNAGRCVVFGPFTDPAADQGHLVGPERVARLGHFGLGAGDILNHEAVVGLANYETWSSLAPRLESLVAGQQQLAATFGRLMAARARSLQDGPNLAVKAHRSRRFRGAF